MPTSVTLPYDGPYDVAAAFDLLAAHAVPGLEEVDRDRGTVRRLLEVDGQMCPVQVTLGAGSAVVTVTDGPVTGDLTRRVRRWFDLDLDPEVLLQHFAADPELGPSVRARPGSRIIGHPVGFEAAVLTVLGQHVSLAAARTFAGRLVAAYGTRGSAGLRLFPGPAALAEVDPVALQATVGVTGARARTVHALAQAGVNGLDLDPDGDLAEAARRLRAVPGIGPWTVSYLGVRALADRDAFPAGDLVLRRALGGVTAGQAEVRSQPWRPYRAYALVHLWSSVWPSRSSGDTR